MLCSTPELTALDAVVSRSHEARHYAMALRQIVLPPLAAVIVGGDADNTGGRSVAHLSDLRAAP